jgi:hypothetical protein
MQQRYVHERDKLIYEAKWEALEAGKAAEQLSKKAAEQLSKIIVTGAKEVLGVTDKYVPKRD